MTRTESVFAFPGQTKRPRLVDEEERHSFTVKSVDDRGQEDPTPAVVWFTPRNDLPETEIVNAPAAVTGPMVFIEWAGTDPDGVIAAYDYRHCGLPMVDAVETFGGAGIESHVIDAFLNYNFHGRTCVLLSPTGTDRGNVCYMGFDLYYLKTYQVKTFLDELLPLFGETLVGEME